MRLMRDFYFQCLEMVGDAFYRESWPKGDHIIFDGAEEGTLWYYRAEDDELIRDWKLGFHDLVAQDWDVYEPSKPLPADS